MTTVDQLLLKIVNYSNPTIDETIQKRDARVLRSLATAISSTKFITENQGRLLVKILGENSEKITFFSEEIKEAISTPTWSKSFRIVEQTKKFTIYKNDEGEQLLSIEFSYNSQIRKIIGQNSRKISGLVNDSSGKSFYAELTEKNIVFLVELLQPLGFEIDEKIIDFYKTIKSWSESEIRGQFMITTMTHSNFQKQITADLGINTSIDQNVINDRRVRYQYFVENLKNPPENLVEILSSRTSPKIWIDRTTCELSQIFNSLEKLRRFPTLLIFDTYDQKQCLQELQNLSKSLEKNGIFDGVGVYFRLPNNNEGTEFNRLIAEKKYNCQLDQDTSVVVVQNGKIPKFFLKSDWKPMSVISIGSPLKQTKTAVYANMCDLIISYTDKEPIIENKVLWE